MHFRNSASDNEGKDIDKEGKGNIVLGSKIHLCLRFDFLLMKRVSGNLEPD